MLCRLQQGARPLKEQQTMVKHPRKQMICRQTVQSAAVELLLQPHNLEIDLLGFWVNYLFLMSHAREWLCWQQDHSNNTKHCLGCQSQSLIVKTIVKTTVQVNCQMKRQRLKRHHLNLHQARANLTQTESQCHHRRYAMSKILQHHQSYRVRPICQRPMILTLFCHQRLQLGHRTQFQCLCCAPTRMLVNVPYLD